MIVVDNVVREGALIDPDTSAPGVQGTRRTLEILSRNPDLSATAIQAVGSKGYDGFVIEIVDGPTVD
jgi:predicted O-methyltransferase YrrM